MIARRVVALIGAAFLMNLWVCVTAGPVDAAEKTVSLKFSNYYPQVAAQSKICEDFIRELETRTGGKVSVRYFPGGSLLNGPGMIKGIESGITDIGLAHIQYTPGRMSVTDVCDLPHGFPSGWVASHVVNDFYNRFKPAEWDKVKPLFFFTNNPSVLVLTKPVRTMDDLKGMTIRAPGPIGEVIKALGGSPAPTPIVETYDALSKGVVDGAFVATETLKTFRFAEVAKYVTQAWHVGSTYTFFIAMNQRAYDSLEPDVKEVLDRLAGEYQELMPLVWNAIDYSGMEVGAEKNVAFTELSVDEFDRWRNAATVVVEDYIARMTASGHPEPQVREWIDFIDQRNAYWTGKQIELKIKSITGPDAIRP